MRKIIAILMLSLAFITNSYAQETSVEQDEQSKVLAARITSTVPQVVAIYSNGIQGGWCTGVVLKNEDTEAVILTARHCLGLADETYVDNVEMTNFKLSFKKDLALIITKSKIPNKIPVTLADKEEDYLKIVYLIGYPKFELYMAAGYTNVRTHNHQMATMKVRHGCSGGGVFNEDGKLVGIVVMGSFEKTDDDSASITIFEPLDNVKEFLRQVKI